MNHHYKSAVPNIFAHQFHFHPPADVLLIKRGAWSPKEESGPRPFPVPHLRPDRLLGVQVLQKQSCANGAAAPEKMKDK